MHKPQEMILSNQSRTKRKSIRLAAFPEKNKKYHATFFGNKLRIASTEQSIDVPKEVILFPSSEPRDIDNIAYHSACSATFFNNKLTIKGIRSLPSSSDNTNALINNPEQPLQEYEKVDYTFLKNNAALFSSQASQQNISPPLEEASHTEILNDKELKWLNIDQDPPLASRSDLQDKILGEEALSENEREWLSVLN